MRCNVRPDRSGTASAQANSQSLCEDPLRDGTRFGGCDAGGPGEPVQGEYLSYPNIAKHLLTSNTPQRVPPHLDPGELRSCTRAVLKSCPGRRDPAQSRPSVAGPRCRYPSSPGWGKNPTTLSTHTHTRTLVCRHEGPKSLPISRPTSTHQLRTMLAKSWLHYGQSLSMWSCLSHKPGFKPMSGNAVRDWQHMARTDHVWSMFV